MKIKKENPQEAARRLLANKIRQGNVSEAVHEYVDENGSPIFWRIRLRHHTTGDKEILPMSFDGGKYQIKEPIFQGKKPLYGLHGLSHRPNDPVYVVEGEWCADHLLGLKVLATTSGGAQSAGQADWLPLKGRNIIIWPDNDDAGKRYSEIVAPKLLALGCKVSIINVDDLGLPAKGDCVDWLKNNPKAKAKNILALPRTEKILHNNQAHTLAKVELLRASEIKPEPIRWLWEGWMAKAKFHILAGAPGTGKTTISMAMAACITRGGKWPDGTGCESGNVLIWTGEDDHRDTLVPRLMAMGADCSRVYFVSDFILDDSRHAFDPSQHLTPLKNAAERIGKISLLIVDPVVSVVAADSHKNAEVRNSLQPLVRLAEQLDCAVLGISHFSKGTAGRDPTERVTGSIAFGAMARVVMATAKTKEDGGKESQILVRTKSNIGVDSGGFRYEFKQVAIKKDVWASKIVWGERVEGNARELLADAEGAGSFSQIDEIREFLGELLSNRAVPAKQVFSDAADAGYSKKQINTAAKKVGVLKKRVGFGSGSKVVWSLCRAPIDSLHSQSRKRESMETYGKGKASIGAKY